MQEPRSWAHKWMIHTVTLAIHFKEGDSHAHVNHMRGLGTCSTTRVEPVLLSLLLLQLLL